MTKSAPADFEPIRSQSALGGKYVIKGIALGPEVAGHRDRYEIAGKRGAQLYVVLVGHMEGSTIVGHSSRVQSRFPASYRWVDATTFHSVEWL